MKIYYPVDDANPVVVMTWEGSQPQMPTIMLNSHMDVVPVFEEYWKHPPFAAKIEENGDIYARGAQDTKCVGTWYLAAIRELKRQGVNQLNRTINIVFVPHEEEGGMLGMDGFTKSDVFKAMNVIFVLDEGSTANPGDGKIPAHYVEKTIWDFELIFHGQSGHGSEFLDDTPGEKLNYVVNKLTEYRKSEKKKLREGNYPNGNVTSINLTILKGGLQSNLIPADMTATFDIRLSINSDIDDFEKQVKLVSFIIRMCIDQFLFHNNFNR